MSATLSLVILSAAIVLGWAMAPRTAKVRVLGLVCGKRHCDAPDAPRAGRSDDGAMLDVWRRGGVL